MEASTWVLTTPCLDKGAGGVGRTPLPHFSAQSHYSFPGISAPEPLAVQAGRSVGCFFSTALMCAVGCTSPLAISQGPPYVLGVPETAATAGSVSVSLFSLLF